MAVSINYADGLGSSETMANTKNEDAEHCGSELLTKPENEEDKKKKRIIYINLLATRKFMK